MSARRILAATAPDPRLPRALRRCWAAYAAALTAYALVMLMQAGASAHLVGATTSQGVQVVLMVSGGGLITWRGIALPEDRVAFLALGLGTCVWGLGQVAAVLATPAGARTPFPSLADVGVVLCYLGQSIAVMRLSGRGLRRLPRGAWLDAAVGALLLAALAATWLLDPLVDAAGSRSAAALALAYPVADVVLLITVVAIGVLRGGRPGVAWATLTLSFACMLAADSQFAVAIARTGTPEPPAGALVALYALAGGLLVAAAMLRPAPSADRAVADRFRHLPPLVLALVAIAVMASEIGGDLARPAGLLLSAACALLGLRAIWTFEENVRLADSRRQALTDPLTGLPNRRGTLALLDDRCAAGEEVAVLVVDLDRFKELNDTLGHQAGDDALAAVAERLRTAVGRNGVLGRLGGDEFTVVAVPGTDEAAAVALGRRLQRALGEPLALRGMRLPVGASIGTAVAAGGRAELLRRADLAMYRAKADGGGVAEYAPTLDTAARGQLALAAELQDAITAGRLEVRFAPKAALGTGEVVGVEALVRWDRPGHGPLEGAELEGLAGRAGLARLLTLEVVGQALREAGTWAAGLPVSARTPAATLLDVRFPDDLTELLVRTGTPPGALTIEVTEDAIRADPERAAAVLERVAALGVEVALDDFGTGWSSLGMLTRLPVRELKIDRSFVAGLPGDPRHATIVRSTIELAHDLGLRVVAEGADTGAAWARLAAWGCDQAQGAVLGPPVRARDLAALRAAQGRRAAA